MYKKKWVSLVLITFLMVFVLGPVNYAATADSDDPVESISAELDVIYQYLTDADKAAIRAAREKLDECTADEYVGLVVWYDETLEIGSRGILEPLLTDAVENRFGDIGSAKNALMDFAKVAGAISYPGEGNWADEFNSYRNDPVLQQSFHTLFDDELTVNDLYDFLYATKQEIPKVIKKETDYINTVTRGTNDAVIEKLPLITEDAMRIVLDKQSGGEYTYAAVRNAFANIGWTPAAIISFQKKLAAAFDTGDAQMALIKGYIRSQTSIVNQENKIIEPTDDVYLLNTGDSLKIMIMGEVIGQIGLVIMQDEKDVTDTWGEDDQGWPIVPGSGDFRVIAYRDFTGFDLAADWLLDGNITVIGEGVAVSGIITSWNDIDDAVVKLYSSTYSDEDIRADMKGGSPENALEDGATLGTTIEYDEVSKRYIQSFSFADVETGTYKVAVYKPGKYVVKVSEEIDVTDTAFDACTLKLWLYGDVTDDGKVTGQDVVQINRYIAKETSIMNAGDDQTMKERIEVANVTAINSSDVEITGQDVVQINRYIAKQTSVFDSID